jgi:hypothetical protein
LSSTTLALAAVDTSSASAQVGWTHVALLCLVSALAVALLLLGLYLWHLRRTRPSSLPAGPGRDAARTGASAPPVPLAALRRQPGGGTPPARRPAGAAGSVGALAVASSSSPATGPVACPACRREYPAGVRFCAYDSRRLVPIGEIVERSRAAGSVCPRCRRSYDAGIKFCPHDAEELIPAPLWEATHGKRVDASPTGVMAKICPQCASRFDLASTFCTRDGAELMTIN